MPSRRRSGGGAKAEDMADPTARGGAALSDTHKDHAIGVKKDGLIIESPSSAWGSAAPVVTWNYGNSAGVCHVCYSRNKAGVCVG